MDNTFTAPMIQAVELLLEQKKYVTIRDVFSTMQAADIAALFDALDDSKLPLLFRLLPKELAAETFVEMDEEAQELLIQGFSDTELKEVVDELYVDDMVDIVEEMPANVVKRILRSADSETRKAINEILKYPDDSAGSIMTTEYVTLRPNMTVEDAIKRIRRTGLDKETIYTSDTTYGDITDELHPLLDENHQCNAVVERTDGHVTVFISIPGATENTTPQTSRHRVLPESPLGESVYMPYTKDESRLQLIASRLSGIDIKKENLQEIIRLAEHYVQLLKISICHEDILWMNKVAKKMNKVCSLHQALGMSEAEKEKISNIYNKVYEAVGDMHSTVDHWPERVFVDHLERLRNDENVNRHLYKKYVNYLKLSRRELYDLYSVLLLIEKLQPLLKGVVANQDEIVAKLRPIFFGDDHEANGFLMDIQTMKPTQITDRVNKMVKEKKISEMSRKRDLWMILHENHLYDKSESNWNSQVL